MGTQFIHGIVARRYELLYAKVAAKHCKTLGSGLWYELDMLLDQKHQQEEQLCVNRQLGSVQYYQEIETAIEAMNHTS